MRPKDFSDFVGQTKAKKQLEILQTSARLRNDAIPHHCLSGPPGTGKTSCARILAYDRNYHEVNGATIKTIPELVKLLKKIKERDILFIDEIHALPNKIQEFLYIVMEDFEYEEGIHRKKLPRFTLIGATTHIGSLNPPLRNRFKHVVEFVEYTLDELAIIVQRVAKVNLGLELSQKFAKLIAGTCRFNPRNTISRAEWIRDCILHEAQNSSIVEVCKSFTPEKLFEMIAGQGVDKHGLMDLDKEYLRVLSDHTEPLGLSSLSSKLGLVKENILNDIEPYLMKLNLVNITSRGRTLNIEVFNQFYPEGL